MYNNQRKFRNKPYDNYKPSHNYRYDDQSHIKDQENSRIQITLENVGAQHRAHDESDSMHNYLTSRKQLPAPPQYNYPQTQNQDLRITLNKTNLGRKFWASPTNFPTTKSYDDDDDDDDNNFEMTKNREIEFTSNERYDKTDNFVRESINEKAKPQELNLQYRHNDYNKNSNKFTYDVDEKGSEDGYMDDYIYENKNQSEMKCYQNWNDSKSNLDQSTKLDNSLSRAKDIASRTRIMLDKIQNWKKISIIKSDKSDSDVHEKEKRNKLNHAYVINNKSVDRNNHLFEEQRKKHIGYYRTDDDFNDDDSSYHHRTNNSEHTLNQQPFDKGFNFEAVKGYKSGNKDSVKSMENLLPLDRARLARMSEDNLILKSNSKFAQLDSKAPETQELLQNIRDLAKILVPQESSGVAQYSIKNKNTDFHETQKFDEIDYDHGPKLNEYNNKLNNLMNITTNKNNFLNADNQLGINSKKHMVGFERIGNKKNICSSSTATNQTIFHESEPDSSTQEIKPPHPTQEVVAPQIIFPPNFLSMPPPLPSYIASPYGYQPIPFPNISPSAIWSQPPPKYPVLPETQAWDQKTKLFLKKMEEEYKDASISPCSSDSLTDHRHTTPLDSQIPFNNKFFLKKKKKVEVEVYKPDKESVVTSDHGQEQKSNVLSNSNQRLISNNQWRIKPTQERVKRTHEMSDYQDDMLMRSDSSYTEADYKKQRHEADEIVSNRKKSRHDQDERKKKSDDKRSDYKSHHQHHHRYHHSRHHVKSPSHNWPTRSIKNKYEKDDNGKLNDSHDSKSHITSRERTRDRSSSKSQFDKTKKKKVPTATLR